MQEYAQKPEKTSSDSNFRSSGQPPISEILQAYKNGTLQRMSVDEEELLQAKTRDKSSERETLQQYTEYTHRDKSRYNSFIQGMFDTPQRKGVGNEEPLQGKFDSSSVASESTIQREVKPNNTGLPDNLKSGIENLSGYSLDDVKVHYNSDKPAQLSALAYAQGTDIHVAPGQERHLPHEAWHVVQQKQGRVQPTMQMQGVSVNDNEGLEKEADMMGGKAAEKSGGITGEHIIHIPENIIQLKNHPDAFHPFVQECKVPPQNLPQAIIRQDEWGIAYLMNNAENPLLLEVAFTQMAQEQRRLVNFYNDNPFPEVEDKSTEVVFIIKFIAHVKAYAYDERVYLYEQEVIYSQSGAGYITRESRNFEGTEVKSSHISSRSELTGLPNIAGDTIYHDYHKKTTNTWIDISRNFYGGGNNGDNSSKLTAERARFEPLMQCDIETLQDNTSFTIGPYTVTAIDMTNNFNSVFKNRRNQRIVYNSLDKLRSLEDHIIYKKTLVNILLKSSVKFHNRIETAKLRLKKIIDEKNREAGHAQLNYQQICIDLKLSDDQYTSDDKRLPVTSQDILESIAQGIWPY